MQMGGSHPLAATTPDDNPEVPTDPTLENLFRGEGGSRRIGIRSAALLNGLSRVFTLTLACFVYWEKIRRETTKPTPSDRIRFGAGRFLEKLIYTTLKKMI